MHILIACTTLGAFIGFFYMWKQTAQNAKRALDEVLSAPVPVDRAARVTRAEVIGRIKGLRWGGSLFLGALGAAAGLFVGAVILALASIAG